jgi:glucokinase
MLELREVVYVDAVPTGIECILGADIGGTNSNFGFFRPPSLKIRQAGRQTGLGEEHLELLFSVHAKSQLVTDFTALVKQILEYVHAKYKIEVKYSAFAAAGVVSEHQDYVKPTNLPIVVDSKEILKQTHLHCAFIVNDFEVIGYGVDSIDPKDLVLVNAGVPRAQANRAIVGAGTGFGKCIMIWDRQLGRHIPSASEGGHADFAPYNLLEMDLVNYIKKERQGNCAVSWEDLLSGDGIRLIYCFFRARAQDESAAHQPPQADDIFKARKQDAHAYATFKLYAKIYARCAKNFALDALALGGVYIAGGIAAKNLPLFEKDIFMTSFINCGKQQELLKEVPIYVITDYNVSLYGVAEYMLIEGMCG